MIDTIICILSKVDVKGKWDINQIANRLDVGTVGTTIKGDSISVNGKLKNMKVYITNDYLRISGSLAKYYFDNNLQTLDSNDIITAIESLGEELGLPIERANIKRLDVGRNIIVRKKVRQYLDGFGDTIGYHKDRTNDRLLYKKTNGTYSVTMYDKVKEMKKNDNDLYQYNRDGYLKDKNILRYEVKLEQKINQLLKYKSVRVVHLRSKTFLKKLNDFWYSKYKSILTKKRFMFDDNINCFQDLKKQLFLKGVESTGISNLYSMLEDLRKRGKITSNQKTYSMRKIKEAIDNEGNLIELDHNVELMKYMDFIRENLDKDEFMHLKNIIVKGEIKGKSKGQIQRKIF